MGNVDYDFSEFKDFFKRMGDAAKGDFRQECEVFLDGIGEEFLRIVQDEIIRREIVDTSLLLHSFSRESESGIWKFEEGGMLLEVGSNLAYAAYVNNGHWTNPKGVAVRMVPGYWRGDTFVYDPNADTAMFLRQQWVDEQPYFDSAYRIMEKMFPKLAEVKLQQWLNKYFGE